MKWAASAAMAALTAASSFALPQTTQSEAFADGKAYKPANTGIKNGINNTALTNVPGQDATTTNDLKGMYGSNLLPSGQSKVTACASFVPGSDAYKNAECDTVNFVSRNPSVRPTYTIDKNNDPLLIISNNIRNTPEAHTAGTSGLSGTYSACVDKTTNLPEQHDTERCQIGRPVTESQCNVTLSVNYTWERYAGQAGADLRYGRCTPGTVRGDQLSLPFTNAYRTEQVQCVDRGHGTGTEVLIWYKSCTAPEVLHGYDASGCTAPPVPAVSDPPRQVIASCTNAPRNNENCFTPTGQFTDKVEAPVFVDNWDYSACADFDSHGAVIRN